jgi:hypothetical protein
MTNKNLKQKAVKGVVWTACCLSHWGLESYRGKGFMEFSTKNSGWKSVCKEEVVSFPNILPLEHFLCRFT